MKPNELLLHFSFLPLERLQFNFCGPFKFEPPEGYFGYGILIEQVHEASKATAKRIGTEFGLFADNLEDRHGISAFAPSKRYFCADSMKQIDGQMKLPAPLTQKTVPSDIAGQRELMKATAIDLSILYARLAILRSVATFHEGSDILSLSISEESRHALFSKLVRLIGLCGSTTNKTKAYLSSASFLPPSSSVSLDSVFRVGGMPLLERMWRSSFCLLKRSLRLGGQSFIRCLLNELEFSTTLVTKGTLAEQFSYDFTSLVPLQSKDEALSDSAALAQPNLGLALWCTNLLIHHLSSEEVSVTVLPDREQIFSNLLKYWFFSLRSNSVVIKCFSVKIIFLLLQHTRLTSSFQPDLESIADISLSRLKKSLLALITTERKSLPLSSIYMQSFVELYSSYKLFSNPVDDRVAVDFGHSGRSFSTNDEDVWSGQVCQADLGWQTPLTLTSPSKPLLLGTSVVSRSSSLSEEDKFSTPDKTSKSDDLEPLLEETLLMPQLDTSEKSRRPELGKVMGVCSWEGGMEGSARLIQWESGRMETVRWGFEGKYDVVPVSVDREGKIYTLPSPSSTLVRGLTKFASAASYGVILRAPRGSFSEKNDCQGTLEWPDFNAIVSVKFVRTGNSSFHITEQKLLSGPETYTGWLVRFGKSVWQPGTRFDVSIETGSGDKFSTKLSGEFLNEALISDEELVKVTGTISLQQSRLFFFDMVYHSPAFSISSDRLMVANTKGGKGVVFGSIGFSRGVHYWEFKIEQSDMGSVFIGVAEKAPNSDTSSCNKWIGSGLVNNRTAFNSLHKSSGGVVYGDHFHSGDLVV